MVKSQIVNPHFRTLFQVYDTNALCHKIKYNLSTAFHFDKPKNRKNVHA